jgi:hypothetical protein
MILYAKNMLFQMKLAFSTPYCISKINKVNSTTATNLLMLHCNHFVLVWVMVNTLKTKSKQIQEILLCGLLNLQFVEMFPVVASCHNCAMVLNGLSFPNRQFNSALLVGWCHCQYTIVGYRSLYLFDTAFMCIFGLH